jgi:2-keto-3-deoxy-L-rhamnonate aldolase RhmA
MEACSTFGLDWLLVDAEAAAVTQADVLRSFQAVTGTGVAPLVRVPRLDHHLVGHMLDIGAHGVLVPKVDSAEAARAVVQAALYPPLGKRGVNPVRASGYFHDVHAYLAAANEHALVLVQVESREAVEAADEIAAVPGIDGLFVGPGDLAVALGQPGDVTGPGMERACARVLDAARRAGKTAGIFAYTDELARRRLADGYRLVAIGNDLKMLRAGVEASLDQVRRSDDVVHPDHLVA